MKLPVDPRLSENQLLKRLHDLLSQICMQVNGVTEGRISVHHEALTAAPTTGKWKQGDFIRNSAPVASGSTAVLGWICVASGEPGTWLAATIGGSGSGTVTSVAATVPSFLSVAGSPVTTSGTLAFSLSGTALPITSGGTGGTSASAARTALGLAIGTDVQAYDADLSDLAALSRTQGDIIYGGSSAWSRLAAGTKRRVLTTAGTGANPSWEAMTVRSVTTATYTLAEADIGHWVEVDFATTAIATVTTATGYALGETTILRQRGAGQVQIAAGSGAKVSYASSAKTRAQNSVIAMTRVSDEGSGTAVFSVYGDTA